MDTTDAAQLKPEEIQALEDKYLFATYKRSELFCARGSGVYVYDLAGRRYGQDILGEYISEEHESVTGT